MEAAPFQEMVPDKKICPGHTVLAKPGEIYIVYFPQKTPAEITLAGDSAYKVEVLDTWNMTVTAVGAAQRGKFTLTPRQAQCAFRITKETKP
jgi:hypothetical protein